MRRKGGGVRRNLKKKGSSRLYGASLGGAREGFEHPRERNNA